MIDIKNVTVEFENKNKVFKAVDDVSLKINKKEIYGIVGFSGAGKSTLVRTINLLQRPTSGEVFIKDRDLVKLSKKELRKERKNIGMIFQHFNLMPSRTILENVLYPLKDSDISKEEKNKRALELLKLVEIEEKKDHYPSELSGGQKQRVAIARALSNNPEILLCDEATSALDPKTTLSILKLLKKVNEELGVTIVLITHEMNVVKEICTGVSIMDKGKIIESGSIIEIFANPQKELTKSFINVANNMDTTIEKIKAHLDPKDFENKKLVKLSYVGESATKGLIVDIYDRFDVKTNILSGNIEFLGDTPFGNLIVINEGKEENIDAAYEYLKAQGTFVEEIYIGG